MTLCQAPMDNYGSIIFVSLFIILNIKVYKFKFCILTQKQQAIEVKYNKKLTQLILYVEVIQSVRFIII